MENEESLSRDPEEFLKSLANQLVESEGVDVGLAEILQIHILTTAPAENAVELAKAAIVKLAEQRATVSSKEAAHG